MRIIKSNIQNNTKDCFASAPVINLTLRSNGEEHVEVIDDFGNIIRAGLTAPTVAPVTTLGAAGSGLTANMFVAYRYVYAAEGVYPLIENAVTAGGSIAPRSNPSPPSVPIQIGGTGNNVNVTIQYSTDSNITRVWIYRTGYYSTSAEALNAANAGTMFFLASITNPSLAAPFTYVDSTTVVTGGESIELDNYFAPIFKLCVYADPYFYGFANQIFKGAITLTAAGIITLTDANQRWYSGRDGQIVTMEGVTSGGFDNVGTYYFKFLTNTTAQLTFDQAGLIASGANFTGTSTVYIRGFSTILYRSKPRNPLSWGTTTDSGIPAPYAFKVGGGVGTAISIVPLLNLLKLDTEGPNKTYVLNLKQAGSTGFENSKREISDTFTVSNHWSQFSAILPEGGSLLWFFDYKFLAICRCDGSTSVTVSAKVFDSIRNLSLDSSSRNFSHGIYDPRTQTSNVWLTKKDSQIVNDLLVVFHHATEMWTVMDANDVLCSASMLNPATNEQISVVGTSTGRIGRMYDPSTFADWLFFGVGPDTGDIFLQRWPKCGTAVSGMAVVISIPAGIDTIDLQRLQNTWTWFVQAGIELHFEDIVRGQGRISTVVDNLDGTITMTFNLLRRGDTYFTNIIDMMLLGATFWIFPGATYCFAETFINLKRPLEAKKLTEVWIQANNVYKIPENTLPYPWVFSLCFTVENSFGLPQLDDNRNLYELLPFYAGLTQDVTNTMDVFVAPVVETREDTFYSKTPIPLDMTRGFVIQFRELGYTDFRFRNYNLVYDNVNAR